MLLTPSPSKLHFDFATIILCNKQIFVSVLTATHLDEADAVGRTDILNPDFGDRGPAGDTARAGKLMIIYG